MLIELFPALTGLWTACIAECGLVVRLRSELFQPRAERIVSGFKVECHVTAW